MRAGVANTTVTNLNQPWVLASGTMVPEGAGLEIISVGAALDTLTSLDYCVEYVYEAA